MFGLKCHAKMYCNSVVYVVPVSTVILICVYSVYRVERLCMPGFISGFLPMGAKSAPSTKVLGGQGSWKHNIFWMGLGACLLGSFKKNGVKEMQTGEF